MKSRVTPFKRWDVEDNYDVIVIGSGIGGLTTASLLSRLAGMKVLVLEQHYEPGGFTHTFKRPGFEWDVGVHYIGGVHPKTMLGKLFDLITDGTLSWEDMGEVYDRAIVGDFSFDFRKGRKNLVADLKAAFPDEHDAIDAYFARVKEATQASGMFFLEKLLPPAISALIGGQVTANFDKIASKTTEEVLDGLTDNALLRAVLTTQWGDYGLPPSRSSFAMHAMVAAHYFYGAYYPVGGSSRIAESILPVIEEAGGKVLVRATVSSVLVENNTAVGVKMEDGREIRAPFIVSNAGASNTFEHLVPPSVRQKFGLTDVFRKVRPSAAHLCLYLGFDETADALGLERANLWITPDEELDHNIARSARESSAPLPVVYVSFPAAKDPDFTRKFPGKATVEAITNVRNMRWVAKWETPWKQRGNDF
ncbi:MAG: NAD(P)/FAD-dependent oxidoreductase [bacterium]